MKPTTTTVELGEIADIQYGLTMRGAVKPLSQKELETVKRSVGLVQMKDLTEYNELNLENIYDIEDDKIGYNHFLKERDILFRSRGMTNTAVYLTDIPKNLVASSPLVVLRVKSTKADPAYVAWFINHTEGQRQIQRFSMGTSLLSVNASALKQMRVQLPPIETQRQIIEIAGLAQQEQILMVQLAEKRSRYLRAVLGSRL